MRKRLTRRFLISWIVASSVVACTATGDEATGSATVDRTQAASTTITSSGTDNASVTTSAAGDATANTSISEPTDGNETPTTTVPETTPSTLEGPRTSAAATPDDPVPVGEVVELPGLWDLSVTDVDFDAADQVLQFADINPPPEEGYRYLLITIEGIYLGDRVAQPAFEWAVSDGETEYLPSIPGCGVIPESIYDVTEVIPGEKFHANVCVPVEEESISNGLSLFLQPLGDEPRYFELD